MVKNSFKVSVLAGLFFVYPAFAGDNALLPQSSTASTQQQQPMDPPAPDGSYQSDLTSNNDHRADATGFNSAANKSTVKSESQHGDSANLPAQAQQLANNKDASRSDFQATPKVDEDLHGHELSEAEESVYENDQQQFEQAQAGMDSDKKNNELSERVYQEQKKLQIDNAKNDSIAIEDDKQRLMLDKQELLKQELAASNHGESLDEFNSPERYEMPMSAENDSTAMPQATPESATPPGPELAMNTQTARAPW